MNKKLKEKIADFMGSEKLADGFEETVDKKQREIEDNKMIARGKENAQEDKKEEEKDILNNPEGENKEEDAENIVVTLDEELDVEIRSRAKEEAEALIAPLREQIKGISESYEREVKELRTKLEEMTELAEQVSEIVENETPVGRQKRNFSINRPSQSKDKEERKGIHIYRHKEMLDQQHFQHENI